MGERKKLKRLDQVLRQIIDGWYERVKQSYVTQEDSRDLGLEPEVKRFHDPFNHRIKFLRKNELNVTYGVGVREVEGRLVVESSVNNKSRGFDFDSFINNLKAHYWRSRHEKPWTDPDFDHYSYEDLMPFEPVLGQSVNLDIRKDKADIIRLRFELNPDHLEELLDRTDVLRDLVDNYCLAPLRRVYAESYRSG